MSKRVTIAALCVAALVAGGVTTTVLASNRSAEAPEEQRFEGAVPTADDVVEAAEAVVECVNDGMSTKREIKFVDEGFSSDGFEYRYSIRIDAGDEKLSADDGPSDEALKAMELERKCQDQILQPVRERYQDDLLSDEFWLAAQTSQLATCLSMHSHRELPSTSPSDLFDALTSDVLTEEEAMECLVDRPPVGASLQR